MNLRDELQEFDWTLVACRDQYRQQARAAITANDSFLARVAAPWTVESQRYSDRFRELVAAYLAERAWWDGDLELS